MVFQEAVLLFVIITLASGLSVTSDARNPIVEIGKNISIQWNISRDDGSSIKLIEISFNLNSNENQQIVASVNSRLLITDFAKDFFENRLQTDFIDNQITLNIANAEYKDSGNYQVEILLKNKENANAAVTLKVYGPPQLCMGNFTNETHLSYTVCGFPMPTVTWGSTENIADGFINGSTKNVTYYAHKYGLFVTPNMCDVLFFKAVGYKNKRISWRKNMKNCNNPATGDSSETLVITVIALVLISILLVVPFVCWRKFKREELQVERRGSDKPNNNDGSRPSNNDEENLTEEALIDGS